jgi:hypothetical protein
VLSVSLIERAVSVEVDAADVRATSPPSERKPCRRASD